MSDLVIGIDPGTSGAIAFLDVDSGWLDVHDVPFFEVIVGGKKRKRVDIPSLIATLTDNGEDRVVGVVLEKVGPQPRDGSASAFAFGESYGAIKACVTAALLPLFDATPQTWKKEFKLNGKGDGAGDMARQIAGQLSPEHAHFFRRKKDHNRADAALIAHFAARNYKSKGSVA